MAGMGKAWFFFDEVMVGPEAMFYLETRASLLKCLWKQQETVWDGVFTFLNTLKAKCKNV